MCSASASLSLLVLSGYAIEERDEHDALTEALSDLRKLDRYERQGWSRQLRAYREFMNLKFVQRLRRKGS